METSRRYLRIIEYFALALLSILLGARFANPDHYGQPLRAHIEFLAESGFPLTIWMALAVLGLRITQEVLGGRIANRGEIKRVLDSFQESFFRSVPSQDQFKHRATLFKARKNLAGQAQYLKVFARSGTAYQKSRTWFRINDESSDPSANEGVAGRAWFTNSQITVTDLPLWPNAGNPSKDAECQRYARDGFLSLETAARLEIKSRSISATVVRNRAGQRWGVLVLDSQEPDGISMTSEKDAMFSLVADLVARHV